MADPGASAATGYACKSAIATARSGITVMSQLLVRSANEQLEGRHSKVSEIAYKVLREAMHLPSINPIGVAHIGATDRVLAGASPLPAYQPARRVVGKSRAVCGGSCVSWCSRPAASFP
jgi:hypothetical protein